MKDHEIAQTVNALRDLAVKYHGTQQLRAQIHALIVPLLQRIRELDLLHYVDDHFFGQEPVVFAGQKAVVTGVTKSIGMDDSVTLTLQIRPLKVRDDPCIR